jgi:hypothetical protein
VFYFEFFLGSIGTYFLSEGNNLFELTKYKPSFSSWLIGDFSVHGILYLIFI